MSDENKLLSFIIIQEIHKLFIKTIMVHQSIKSIPVIRVWKDNQGIHLSQYSARLQTLIEMMQDHDQAYVIVSTILNYDIHHLIQHPL
jgi:predicted SpoU family rRNA methylase